MLTVYVLMSCITGIQCVPLPTPYQDQAMCQANADFLNRSYSNQTATTYCAEWHVVPGDKK